MHWAAMTTPLKQYNTTTGGKGRGEIRSEAGEVTGVVANVSTTDGLEKGYGAFGGWGWQLEKWRYCSGG